MNHSEPQAWRLRGVPRDLPAPSGQAGL